MVGQTPAPAASPRTGVLLPVVENIRSLTTIDRQQGPVLDPYVGDLAVAYAFGPAVTDRLVRRSDLDGLGLDHDGLRRVALAGLQDLAPRAEVHGQPPTLMVSFGGLEASLLLVDEIWHRLAPSLPGEVTVGIPARDIMIVTGSGSPAGLERARRACDRVAFAGSDRVLSEDLLVRRAGVWEVY